MDNENAELGRLLVEADQLTKKIVDQKSKLKYLADKPDEYKKGISDLNDMMSYAENLAKRIIELQDKIVKEKNIRKEYKEYESANVQKNEQEPKNLKKTDSKKLIDDGNFFEEDNTYVKRKQRELTVEQIKAVGDIPLNYVGVKNAENIANQVAAKDNDLRCTWHPWRKAYKECDYCKRPFCFEDIVEKRGKFYCLEDVDKSLSNELEGLSSTYNNLNMFSAGTMMFIFLLFLYFGYGQIVYQLNNFIIANSNLNAGLIAFRSFFLFDNFFPLAGLLLTVFGFLGSIMLLGKTSKSFVLSIIVDMLSIILFSYAYLSYIRFYILILSILSFVAMITLLISKGIEYAYIGEREERYMNANLSNLGIY